MFTAITEVFSSVAAERPAQIAISQEGSFLTYGELETRGNRLAWALREAGVGSTSVVGLCAARSTDYVIGALGILKAGAAYVPLDPGLPLARFDFMIQDAGVCCVVTTSRQQSGRRLGGRVLLVDDVAEDPSRPELSHVKVDPEQLAYVMYTSGTTGTPKGVEITHRGVANLVQWCRRAFQIVPTDRTTLFAPVGFDAAVRELWPHLTSGCTLHVPPDGLLRDPDELQDWLVRNDITISYLPTLLAGRLVRMSWPERTKLRYVYTGGDALRDYPVPGLPFCFVNEYGPAECTVFASSAIVSPRSNPAHPPTIGRAIDGAQIFILDEDLAEVSQGETGEIHISGEGLARGYRNNPELTSRRFILGVQGESRGKRIYKTGDLGRYSVDGEIAFLGRNDDQVKIRGYRIECGDVETSINQIEGIIGSAVVKRQFGASDYRLVAYVATSIEREFKREELREFLRARLPEYMIPEEFVQMRELPVTSNGKVDKARLPDLSDSQVIRNAEEGESVVERHLILMLQKLLGVQQVGRHDNIFLLGGNSFISMQLITQIKRDFRVTLTPREVFAKPTLAELASQVEKVITAHIAKRELHQAIQQTPESA
jgi:amino acid adenylation domain-containing protein